MSFSDTETFAQYPPILCLRITRPVAVEFVDGTTCVPVNLAIYNSAVVEFTLPVANKVSM